MISSNPDALELYHRANELFISENYVLAETVYTKAISLDGKNAEFYIKRSTANAKLKRFTAACMDGKEAVKLCPRSDLAYLRLGIAQHNSEQYKEAHESLLNAKLYSKTDNLTLINEWLQRTETELDKLGIDCTKDAPVPVDHNDDLKNSSLASSELKYEWYQSVSHVTLNVLEKKVKGENVSVAFKTTSFEIDIILENRAKKHLRIELQNDIKPEASSFTMLGTKIEVKLKKDVDGVMWPNLIATKEASRNNLGDAIKVPMDKESPQRKAVAGKKKKNWDKLEMDMLEEEKSEQPQGDAGVQALFKQIYANADERTRMAMNKSFQESGGTVLSTNWNEIGTKKTEVKPPDGVTSQKF